MPRVAWLVGAVVLALGAAPAVGQGPAEQIDASIRDGSAQRALDTARARWFAAEISSYRYLLGTSCLFVCAGPEPVTVRNGERRARGSLTSVGRLFEHIQQAIDGRYRRLGVSYGRYGVPRRVNTEVSLSLQDDFHGVTVTGFRRFTVDRSIRNGSARRVLVAARGAWLALGLRSYSFEILPPVCRERACLARRWTTSVVRDGRPLNRSLRPWGTIPRLLATIERAIGDEVESLDVRYDASGLPRSIRIREIDVRHAEIALRIRRLRPLGAACANTRAAC